jgi:hypothetical protein
MMKVRKVSRKKGRRAEGQKAGREKGFQIR